MPVPTANEHAIGTAIVSNVTVQYFIAFYFWPEFAFNDTYWASGVRGGKNQLFLSPGIVFGRFVLFDRLKAVFGISYHPARQENACGLAVVSPIDRPARRKLTLKQCVVRSRATPHARAPQATRWNHQPRPDRLIGSQSARI
jgi:hypothetical protein